MCNENGLRNMRIRHHLSQKALADATGTTPTSISRYESGKRKLPVDTAKRLAHYMGENWVMLFTTPDDACIAGEQNER